MLLKDVFENLELSENHSQIYEALLRDGRSSVLEIAKITGIPRSSCYEYLPELVGQGLIKEVMDKNAKMFEALPPEKLLELFSKKLHGIEKSYENLLIIKDDLEDLYNRSFAEPRVKYFAGRKNISKILSQIIKQKPKELRVLSSNSDLNLGIIIDEQFGVDFFEKLKRQRTFLREIITYSPEGFRYKDRHNSELHEIELLKTDEDKSLSSIIKFIWDNAYLVIDLSRLMATMVTDKSFSNYEARYFDAIWQKLIENN